MDWRGEFRAFYQERKPYLKVYISRCLEDACLSGAAGFLASLAAGLSTGYTLRFALLTAALTGVVSFLRELKRGRNYEERSSNS